MQKRTQFEFRYKNEFSIVSALNGYVLVPAERKVAQLVDDSWCYSMHWPSEINSEWVSSVMDDINTEINYAKERLKRLELAKKIINTLELHDNAVDLCNK